MEKKERILNWVAKNATPNQDLCPELIQYWWNSKKECVLWSNKTGKRTETGRTRRTMRITSNYVSVGWSQMSGAYVERESDMLIFARVNLYGCDRRGKDGQPKEWEWDRHSFVFLFAHDPIAYGADGNPLTFGQKKYVNQSAINWFSDFYKGVYEDWQLDILGMFLRENYGIDKNFKYGYEYDEFYRTQWIKRNRSKAAEQVLDYEFEPLEYPYLSVDVTDDGEYGVIRVGSNYRHEEKSRIFVSKKGKVSITVNDYGRWVLTPNRSWYRQDVGVSLTPEMYAVWEPLKWISPCIDWKEDAIYNNNANVAQIIKQTIALLRHPIIETISKAGYPHIAKNLAIDNEVAKNLERQFGAKERKGNLYKVLGVNKHFLRKLEDYLAASSWYRGSFAKDLKEIMGRDDLTSLSKETIDGLCAGLFKLCGDCGWKYEIRENYNGRYWYRRQDNGALTDIERERALWLIKKGTKYPDFINVFLDTNRMMHGLTDAPDIDLWSVENEAALLRIHDALVEMKNYEKLHLDELRQQKFEKLNKKRIERFEHEDAEFIIRVPRQLSEIVREGSLLHHCVGGYTNSVAEGRTNILFLRRKSSPDMPFYTIEVRENDLVQIHGSCNKWLGNDPEAIPFVYEWLHKIGVTFDVSILLNLGQGYGRAREALDESYLHRKEVA